MSGGLQVETWNAIGHILHVMDWYEILYGMLSLLEHSHQRMLLYPILPSQKVTLLIIQYHFPIHPTSQLLFFYSTH